MNRAVNIQRKENCKMTRNINERGDGEAEEKEVSLIKKTFIEDGVSCHDRDTYDLTRNCIDEQNCPVNRATGNSLALSDADVSIVEFKKARCRQGFTHKEEDGFLEGLYRRAEALYHMGEFELAMVLYSRGSCIRPRMSTFKIGMRKAHKAITNALSTKSSVQSADMVEYLRHMPERTSGAQPEDRFILTSHTPKAYVTSMPEEKQDRNIKMSETLKEQDRLIRPQDDKVKETVDEINKFIVERKNSWKTQSSLYSRRRKRAEVDRTVVERAEQLRKIIQDEREKTQCDLKEKLERLAWLHGRGQILEAEEAALAILNVLEGRRNRVLPNKLQYYVLVYNFLALVYIHRGRYDLAKKYSEELLEVAMETGQECHLCRAYGTIGKMHAAFGRYSWALKTWEEMIPLVKDIHLLSWLFHEMGRCYFELNKIETARVYAGWSHDSAKSVSDRFWRQNALILIAQCELHLGDSEAAMEAFKNAQELVIDLKTRDYVQQCIRKIEHSIQVSEVKLGLTCRRRIQLRISGKPLVHFIGASRKLEEGCNKDDILTFNNKGQSDVCNQGDSPLETKKIDNFSLPENKSGDDIKGTAVELLNCEVARYNEKINSSNYIQNMGTVTSSASVKDKQIIQFGNQEKLKRKTVSLVDVQKGEESSTSESRARKAYSLDNVKDEIDGFTVDTKNGASDKPTQFRNRKESHRIINIKTEKVDASSSRDEVVQCQAVRKKANSGSRINIKNEGRVSLKDTQTRKSYSLIDIKEKKTDIKKRKGMRTVVKKNGDSDSQVNIRKVRGMDVTNSSQRRRVDLNLDAIQNLEKASSDTGKTGKQVRIIYGQVQKDVSLARVKIMAERKADKLVGTQTGNEKITEFPYSIQKKNQNVRKEQSIDKNFTNESSTRGIRKVQISPYASSKLGKKPLLCPSKRN